VPGIGILSDTKGPIPEPKPLKEEEPKIRHKEGRIKQGGRP
jgi:hypothetical protein